MTSTEQGPAGKDDEFLYLVGQGADLLQAGKVPEARTAFEKALEKNPGHEQARNMLALCFFRQGQYNLAEKHFRQLVDENPVEPSLRLNLAMVHLKCGELVEAQLELERVLDLAGEHRRAINYMGLVHERLGSYAEAATWYRKANNTKRAEQMEIAAKAMKQEAEAEPEVVTGSVVEDEPPPPPPPPDEPVEATSASMPAVEAPATAEVEAAALNAARVESLKKTPAPPAPGVVEAARSSGVGFTLDVDDVPAPPEEPDSFEEIPTGTFERPPLAELLKARAARAEADSQPEPEPPPPEPEPVEKTRPFAQMPVAPEGNAAAKPEASAAAPATGGQVVTLEQVEDARPWARNAAAPMTTEDGLVYFPIDDVAYLRTDRLVGLRGQFEVEPLNRRYRGRRTDSLFGGNKTPMVAALGEGVGWLDAGTEHVVILSLDSEELYLIEGALLAFSSGLAWENGRLPADIGREMDLDIVHLRGSGLAIVTTQRPLMGVPVGAERPVTVTADRLVGWNGQIVPYRGPFPGLPESAQRPHIVRFEGNGRVLCT
jgi:uncharacterized protein (AIM24 family)/predicted negative regulator of RcsB-dependent stress response